MPATRCLFCCHESGVRIPALWRQRCCPSHEAALRTGDAGSQILAETLATYVAEDERRKARASERAKAAYAARKARATA